MNIYRKQGMKSGHKMYSYNSKSHNKVVHLAMGYYATSLCSHKVIENEIKTNKVPKGFHICLNCKKIENAATAKLLLELGKMALSDAGV